jgi:hypothetical protein
MIEYPEAASASGYAQLVEDYRGLPAQPIGSRAGRPGRYGGYAASVIVDRLDLSPDEFARGTGWEIKSQGACKAQVCVPLPRESPFDALEAAARLGMAVVHDETADLWAFGPESLGSRALVSAKAPDVQLPDIDGRTFSLSSLRGQKVVLVAWSPY